MAQCISPIVLKKRDEPNAEGFSHDKVPCGKCAPCHKRRASHWVFRLKQELKQSTSAIFLTLTYEDEHVPLVKCQGITIPQMTLDYSHHQNFMKTLRNNCIQDNTLPLKYYAVGEYGEKYERPHFHYILFNLHDYEKEENFLSYIWNKGKIDIGEVTSASIAYVSGYVNKKIIKSKHQNELRLLEKSFMSKGLGRDYLTPQIQKYYHTKLLPYLHIEGGQKLSMPRYYKDKLYDIYQKTYINSIVTNEMRANEIPLRDLWEKNKAIYQKAQKTALYRSNKLYH